MSLFLKILRKYSELKKVAITFFIQKQPSIYLDLRSIKFFPGRAVMNNESTQSDPVLCCDVLQNLYQSRFVGLASMASPSRSSQSRRRCKDGSRLGLAHTEALVLPRSTSDTDLVSLQSRSTLTVSSSLFCIGQSEDIVITWDVTEEVDAGDWIGMYLIGENTSLTVKLYGFISSQYCETLCKQ